MQTPPIPNQSPKRIVFNRDARLSVVRFDRAAAATPGNDGKIATLKGYAMLWNVLSDDRGGYKVRLLPGSGTPDDPTVALFHHNFAAILGNTENTTLRIVPDDIGVGVEIDLPDTTTGRDAEELVEKKYVRGMSFAMVGAPTFAMTTENGQKIMNVSKFLYDEVTVTAIPSFTQATIGIAEDDVAEISGMQAAKKNSDSVKQRDAQALKAMKYRLASLAEFQR